jgi:hypothetical protein
MPSGSPYSLATDTLDEALTRLAATDKPTADLVHLRFFAGLPMADAAAMLGISPRTARPFVGVRPCLAPPGDFKAALPEVILEKSVA